MSRARWLAAVWIAAALVPLAVFHRTAVAPATRLVAALPSANPLDDPATNATAIARAWARWERGDVRIADDRVFAPVPDALATGEWLPLASIVGYPFRALTGSVPAGVNAAYFLAVFTFPVLLYALYARLAGPGLVPAAAAFAVAYGPGRMNTLGVLAGLSTGFALLAAMAACDFLRRGRGRELALFGAALVVQGLFSLYGIALGLVFAVPAVLIVAGKGAFRARRAAALAGTGLAAFLVLAVPYGPYFRIGESLGVVPGLRTFEAHSADLLSLLHGGIFGGPVRDALERLVPGFPLGAAAFFPTLAFAFAIGVWAARGRSTRSPIPWLGLAAALFLCSLGPTIHVAGRPVGPGPYRLLTGLPILSSLRGIHRFDQWFDVAIGAAAVLSLAAVAGHARAAAFRAAFAGLALLDLWPADIPATAFPAPSAYVDRLGALPRDASIAVYPWNRSTSTQAWIDQLSHRRRVVNGWFTYAPATHTWAERTLASLPVPGGVALLREMGASVVVVDRRALSSPALADVDALAAGSGGIEAREEVTGFTLLRLDRRDPCFVRPGAPSLVFRGRTAEASCRPDGLVFRAGPEERDVLLRPSGAPAVRASLRAPVASPPPLRFTLSADAPAGAGVEDAKSGRILGRVTAR
ncbi:MAG TPA: hypothetical protein VGM13_02455 [Thermoanaerobaculia bacterium]|jgi:hypothetical protein